MAAFAGAENVPKDSAYGKKRKAPKTSAPPAVTTGTDLQAQVCMTQPPPAAGPALAASTA